MCGGEGLIHLLEDGGFRASATEVMVDEVAGCVLKGDEAGEARTHPGVVERLQRVGEEVVGGRVERRVDCHAARWPGWPPA